MKRWRKPIATVESFEANSYISTCYTYTADFRCSIGARHGKDSQGLDHGDPCALTKATDISGSTGTGTETGAKAGNPIYAINVPGISDSNDVGDVINGVSWQSSWDGLVYYHTGSATITSKVLVDSSRPNHS